MCATVSVCCVGDVVLVKWHATCLLSRKQRSLLFMVDKARWVPDQVSYIAYISGVCVCLFLSRDIHPQPHSGVVMCMYGTAASDRLPSELVSCTVVRSSSFLPSLPPSFLASFLPCFLSIFLASLLPSFQILRPRQLVKFVAKPFQLCAGSNHLLACNFTTNTDGAIIFLLTRPVFACATLVMVGGITVGSVEK